MEVNNLDLAHEFPEHKDRIHELKVSHTHFRRLYDEYVEACRQIKQLEERVRLCSEMEEEKLRKQRLKLKDELYSFLVNAN